MATNYKMTWRPEGRWRKVYKGKTLYFDGSGGKVASYQRAWSEFLVAKERIDQEREENGDDEDVGTSVRRWYAERIDEMQAKILDSTPDSQEMRAIYQLLDVMKQAGPIDRGDNYAPIEIAQLVASIVPQKGTPPKGVPPWRDPLAVGQDARPATISQLVKLFLDDQRTDAKNGSISKSRFENIRANISTFTNYLGDHFDVDLLNAKLEPYRDHIRKLVHNEKLSGYSGRDKLAAVRLLMVYSNRKKWIPLDDIFTIKGREGFGVKLVRGKVKAPAVADIERLASVASERELLYLLLGINCGMTPMEISTLEHEHIGDGTITRKRNKTGESGTVPEVTYHLWPLTSKLLDQYRSDHKKLAILTLDGTPLVDHTFRPDGSVLKRDSIHSAWCRLCKRAGVNIQFKALRKSSATLLQTSDHRGFVDLFLGHAAASIAAKHYVDSDADTPPFRKALQWLGEQYSAITKMKPSKGRKKRR